MTDYKVHIHFLLKINDCMEFVYFNNKKFGSPKQILNHPDHSLNGSGPHDQLESRESVLPGHTNDVGNDSILSVKEAFEP